MGTDAPILMPTETDHLTLMQWFSPGFPVGAFAYSHGLERTVERGDVADADSFRNWLADILHHGTGRADAILIHCAYRAREPSELTALDTFARALAPSAERRMETELQGQAFAETTAAIWHAGAAPRAYPIAVGSAARHQGLNSIDVVAAYLHAFAANLTSAAIRLIPLGQTEGQSVLAALSPSCRAIATETADCSTDDIGSAIFAADIASMQHEIQYSRQFRS